MYCKMIMIIIITVIIIIIILIIIIIMKKKFGSKGEVRMRFRLRTVSAGLLGDKERCRMCKDGKCELCDEGVVKDVHFLLHWRVCR